MKERTQIMVVKEDGEDISDALRLENMLRRG